MKAATRSLSDDDWRTPKFRLALPGELRLNPVQLGGTDVGPNLSRYSRCVVVVPTADLLNYPDTEYSNEPRQDVTRVPTEKVDELRVKLWRGSVEVTELL